MSATSDSAAILKALIADLQAEVARLHAEKMTLHETVAGLQNDLSQARERNEHLRQQSADIAEDRDRLFRQLHQGTDASS